MKKARQPLSSKKPPIPSQDHTIITEWMQNRVMPSRQPMVKQIDQLITECIPDLQYSIKWGSAYYGTPVLGWLIELAPYSVSVNIVFLSGAAFTPPPPLGSDEQSRYIKLSTIDEVLDPKIRHWIEQAKQINGWQ